MGTVYISEHSALGYSLTKHLSDVLVNPPSVSYTLSSASTPQVPQAGTRFIRAIADVAAGVYLGFTALSSSPFAPLTPHKRARPSTKNMKECFSSLHLVLTT